MNIPTSWGMLGSVPPYSHDCLRTMQTIRLTRARDAAQSVQCLPSNAEALAST